MKIYIINSGLSNVSSVANMVKWVGFTPIVTQSIKEVNEEDKIIFPGIGNFSQAMSNLKDLDIIDDIKKSVLVRKNDFLGICLGAQMLAKNLGGSVQKSHDLTLEIGFFDINPTGDGHKMFQSQKKFFQWHREGFTVPQSCEILAKGDLFREQAFRYKNALAIQFHPEVNLKMHLRWLYYAGYMLKEKGAQNRREQLTHRLKHGKKINLWLDSFLDNYLLKDINS